MSAIEVAPAVAAPARTGVPVRYGISEPISLQEPTDADHALSDRMMEELEALFPSETTERMELRKSVLKELEDIAREWVAEVGAESGVAEEARRASFKFVTLGSYRLGVVHPLSDIDVLCIGPPHVSREAFFTTFADKLKPLEQVKECVPIPNANTPIIKIEMRGVKIDLSFARIAKSLADSEDLEDAVKEDKLLKNMDEKSIRCMNGFRVANQILQLVPNQESFRKTLRFVKCWARRRGIYSNVLGFFGGITWALLVARVCQLYPHYSASQLVNRFFRTYDQWNWSKPVMLCEIVDPQTMPGLSSHRVWNPKTNLADRAHVMPVITPAFPAMNSAHNVTETTKRILLDEFRRGYEVVKSVEAQKVPWSEVHDPFPFFKTYRHFVWLEILAKTDEVYQKFSGLVESKLRILTKHLESLTGMVIHPNPEQYKLRNPDGQWPLGCGMFIALAFFKDKGACVGMTVDLREPLRPFVEVINQNSEKDLYVGKFLLRMKKICASELPEYALLSEDQRKRPRQEGDASASEAKRARLPGGE